MRIHKYILYKYVRITAMLKKKAKMKIKISEKLQLKTKKIKTPS